MRTGLRAGVRAGRRALLPAAAVALVGILLAGVVGVGLHVLQQRTVSDAMDRKAALVGTAVRAETGRYVDTLQATAASVGALDMLTAAQFGQVAAPLKHMGLAGATSIAFLVPATDGQVPQVQALWRQRGLPNLRLQPSGTGREHVFSIFSEPFDGVAGAPVGVDVSQAGPPTRALNEARRAGQVSMSDSYLLIRDRGLPAARQQRSFVLTAAVYGPATAAGPRQFRGWVLLGLRSRDFVDAVVARLASIKVDLGIDAVNADGTVDSVATVRNAGDGRRSQHRVLEVAVAQRRWLVHVDATGDDLPGAGPLPAAMAGSILAITGALSVLTLVLATGRARADAQVRAATARLRRAEAQARDQADLLTAVLDSVSDGVGVVDEHGAFLVHNPAAKAILGVPEDATNQADWQAHYGIFRPDGSTPFPSGELPLALALHGHSTEQVPMVIRNTSNPDGIVLTVSARPLHRPGGPAGAVAVFHDTTARAAADRQVAEATARLRAELERRTAAEAEIGRAHDDLAAQQAYLTEVLDAIDVTVVTCDVDGVLVHANRFARHALPPPEPGTRINIVDGARRSSLTHPDGTPFTAAETPLARALRGEHVDGVEAHVMRPDGKRETIVLHARPLHDRDGRINGAVGSSYQITALREREAELAAFAGVVAHDLKSPLTAISGYTELVRAALGVAGDEENAGLLGLVLGTTQRMRRLIDDLLSYAAARDTTIAGGPVDLRAVVDDVVTERLAALAADPTGPPPQVFVGALPIVDGDAGLLRQLLDNLIGNAIKYTPPGQPARVDVTGTVDARGWASIEVADRGIGIPEGQHAAVFTSFHRAHSASGYAGTGLGLAICQRVVQRHGGTITAQDNPGGGTRFTFTLPKARLPRASAGRPADWAHPPAR